MSSRMPKLTFAFCTFNRADRLEKLVAAMRAQTCPIPFEILAINNNSSDSTAEVLAHLAQLPGPPLRWVTEPVQGIVAARNRGIAEALDSDILVYIDDDEIPLPGLPGKSPLQDLFKPLCLVYPVCHQFHRGSSTYRLDFPFFNKHL